METIIQKARSNFNKNYYSKQNNKIKKDKGKNINDVIQKIV